MGKVKRMGGSTGGWTQVRPIKGKKVLMGLTYIKRTPEQVAELKRKTQEELKTARERQKADISQKLTLTKGNVKTLEETQAMANQMYSPNRNIRRIGVESVAKHVETGKQKAKETVQKQCAKASPEIRTPVEGEKAIIGPVDPLLGTLQPIPSMRFAMQHLKAFHKDLVGREEELLKKYGELAENVSSQVMGEEGRLKLINEKNAALQAVWNSNRAVDDPSEEPADPPSNSQMNELKTMTKKITEDNDKQRREKYENLLYAVSDRWYAFVQDNYLFANEGWPTIDTSTGNYIDADMFEQYREISQSVAGATGDIKKGVVAGLEGWYPTQGSIAKLLERIGGRSSINMLEAYFYDMSGLTEKIVTQQVAGGYHATDWTSRKLWPYCQSRFDSLMHILRYKDQ